MGFARPELLLLALPAAWAWWSLRASDRLTSGLRALLLAALVLALAGPYLHTASRGRDLVLLVDRSRSVPAEADASALELARLVEEARRDGDRVAVVSFGADAQIERQPSATARFGRFERTVDADGSDLAGALDLALDLIPPERPGSILLVSDGESNGRDPLAPARRAFARGVRVDVRSVPRADVADLSVERIELPEDVAPGEPFQFAAWVRSDRRLEAEFTLERAGAVVARGQRVFEAGMNRITLRDVLVEPGVGEYRLRVAHAEDRVPENDAALAAVRVGTPRALLVLNDDGSADALVQALRAAAIPVRVARPEELRLDAVSLASFRGVVLENVAADRLGTGLRTVASFVHDLGGGLLVTGGRASFGTGGYFRSVLDPLLPVSMEMRQEQRKQSIALAITMDRSGSMSMPAAEGLTKMDLANLGAVAAIELLSPMDAVAVIAVDSAPHVVQELTPVEDVGELTRRVRKIESAGGGIFTYTALLAAGKQLEEAEQVTRHVILFADAADSEEQERCPELIAQMVRAGMSVSVIALGTEQDVDSAFLKSVAAAGNGQAYFTTDPGELPRLFAQDTMTVSRATFVEEPTACRVLPDLYGLGAVSDVSFASLAGYNLTYLRGGAVAGVVTVDDNAAPVVAFQQAGLGRTAAFTGQIGGTFGAQVVAWEGFAGFFTTLARWIAGQEEPSEVFASVRRDGRDAVVTLEVEPGRAAQLELEKAVGRLSSADGEARQLTFQRVAEQRWEARARLAADGVALGSVGLPDGRNLRLAPIALPYSPEFERRGEAGWGERLLRRIAAESGGIVNPAAGELLRGERTGRGWRPIGAELALLALALLVLEIAVRRLELAALVRVPAPLARLARRLAVRPPRPARSGGSDAAHGAAPDGATADGATTPAAEAPPQDVGSALEAARRAAGKRLSR